MLTITIYLTGVHVARHKSEIIFIVNLDTNEINKNEFEKKRLSCPEGPTSLNHRDLNH